MDGKQRDARYERWLARAAAAYDRMFCAENQEGLVTLTEREDMAVALGKEMAAFLLEEHVAADPAKAPAEASTACCPKCGQPGTRAAQQAGKEGEGLPERTVTTRAGDIDIRRERWKCAKCRVVFFSARRSAAVGDGGLQPERVSEGGSPGEQGVVLCRGKRRPAGVGGRGDQPDASATAK